MRLCCVQCARETDRLPADCGCPSCGGLLEARMPVPHLPDDWRKRPLGVWRYKEFLPHKQTLVSLAEGGTPLLDVPRIAHAVGVRRLQVKLEGMNPTGSFKDRGMTTGVSWAVSEGATVVGCASTGNTAASMAAYAARAGVHAVVVLPAGQVAIGKVAQALAHGARVVEVEGSFDDAMDLVVDLARDGAIALLNSKNPARLEGQKTIAFEVLDQRAEPELARGGPTSPVQTVHAATTATTAIAKGPNGSNRPYDASMPDAIVYPVGNAGNISAGHKGLLESRAAGLLDGMPRLFGVQASGAAPVVAAFRSGASDVTPVDRPSTHATAIRIGRPVSSTKALRALRDTRGSATAVSDDAITAMQRDLAREGIFCEPASAASVAGLRQFVAEGSLGRDDEVVCVLTGHGLKDPAAAERLASPPVRARATRESVLAAITQPLHPASRTGHP